MIFDVGWSVFFFFLVLFLATEEPADRNVDGLEIPLAFYCIAFLGLILFLIWRKVVYLDGNNRWETRAVSGNISV